MGIDGRVEGLWAAGDGLWAGVEGDIWIQRSLRSGDQIADGAAELTLVCDVAGV